MKVVRKLFITTLVLSVALGVSGVPKNSMLSRFVMTFDIPGGGFFEDLPFIQSIDDAMEHVAEQFNATWSKIKNYTIPGMNVLVSELSPMLAQAVSKLPFVKTLEADVQVQLDQDFTVVELSAEETPYGIDMVRAFDVPDDQVGNRIVCIIDTGYDIEHPDLPGGATGDDFGAGPWYQDGNGHVSRRFWIIIFKRFTDRCFFFPGHTRRRNHNGHWKQWGRRCWCKSEWADWCLYCALL
jgi:subtilisin family serine protease